MNFIVDQQTQNDLNISGKYRANSIFSLFNKVKTAGGERILQQMFQTPLTDSHSINERSALFRYIEEAGISFPFDGIQFRLVEDYLGTKNRDPYPLALLKLFSNKMKGLFVRDPAFDDLVNGLNATHSLLQTAHNFVERYSDQPPSTFDGQVERFTTALKDSRLQKLMSETDLTACSVAKIAAYDFLLRNKLEKEMTMLMETVFQLDVYTTVAAVCRANQFCYATSVEKSLNTLEIDSLVHPALPKGIANTVSLNELENMIFLTGANMAGKSTLMKAFGIAIYLAHMGFPVPAKSMHFSVRDGIFSSINMADNLEMGHSHFYAEVLRVKAAANAVASGKRFVVLFDELFKGTNVKDAYDGTFLVTEAFAKYRTSIFIISTHIIEVGESLQTTANNVQFKYLPTIMNGTKPKYTYLLQQGITADRQGMLIIENEGILELLKD